MWSQMFKRLAVPLCGDPDDVRTGCRYFIGVRKGLVPVEYKCPLLYSPIKL